MTGWNPGRPLGPHAGCCPPRGVPGSHHLTGCPDHREPTEAENLLADRRKQAERDAEAAYDTAMREAGF